MREEVGIGGALGGQEQERERDGEGGKGVAGEEDAESVHVAGAALEDSDAGAADAAGKGECAVAEDANGAEDGSARNDPLVPAARLESPTAEQRRDGVAHKTYLREGEAGVLAQDTHFPCHHS